MPCSAVLPCPTTTQEDGCLICVEDNPVNGMLLEEFFGRLMGLPVQVAATGALGLALARAGRPMALLLDMMLPDMDGLEVLARLRADPLTRDLPVVIVSGQLEPQQWAAARALGAIACWPKPLDFSQLDQLLQQALPQVAARCLRPTLA